MGKKYSLYSSEEIEAIAKLEAAEIVALLEPDILLGDKDTIEALEKIYSKLDEKKRKETSDLFKTKNIDLPSAIAVLGKPKFTGFLHLVNEDLGGANISENLVANNSLMHIAARGGHLRMVEILVKKELDINAANSRLETPILLSVSAGHKEVAEFLIKQQADASLPNILAETPLMYAQEFGLESVVNLLNRNLTGKNESNFVSDSLFVKKIGQALALQAKIELEIETETYKKKTNIETENLFTAPSLQNLADFLSLYINGTSFRTEVKEDFDHIFEAFKVTAEFSKHNGNVSLENMVKRFREGSLTIIPSGWRGHAITEVLYKDNIIDSNCGKGIKTKGIVVRKIKDVEAVSAEYIATLDLPALKKDQGSVLENISRAVDLNTVEQILPTKVQQWGSSTFANPKASILGMLYLLKLERLNATQKMKIEEPEMLSALGAKKEADIKTQALEYAQHEYKKFTHFIRNAAVDELLKNYHDNTVTPQKKKISFALLVEYIVAHHGQPKKGLSQPGNLKRASEIERMERIFKGLDDSGRKALLQALKDRGIRLYEIAKASTDLGYKALLEDLWTIKKSDILSL